MQGMCKENKDLEEKWKPVKNFEVEKIDFQNL